MTYLLDTNAWLRWFHRPGEISKGTRDLLNAEQTVALSPMTIVEVAQKFSKGKLTLPLPIDIWVNDSQPPGRVKLLPITPRIALRAYEWPDVRFLEATHQTASSLLYG